MRCILAALFMTLPTVANCQWVEFQACGLMPVANGGYGTFSGQARNIRGFNVWAPSVTHITTYMPTIVKASKTECVNLWIGTGSLLVIGSQGDVMKKLRAAKCKEGK